MARIVRRRTIHCSARERSMDSTQLDDVDEQTRRRLIVVAAGVLTVIAVYFMVRRFAETSMDGTAIALASGASLTFVTALWARRAPSRGPAHLLCGVGFLILAAISHGNGGVTAPAAEWFIVIVMLSLFLLGPRVSMTYAVLSAFVLTGYHLADAMGMPLPVPPEARYLAPVRLASRVVALCFVVFIGWRFAREKQRASASAHAARDDLDVVLRNLPQGVLVVREGVVRSANDSVVHMLDTSADELAGTPVDQLIPSHSFDEGNASPFECELSSPTGGRVAARVTPVVLRDVRGRKVLLLSIEDLRQRLALEQQLRTSERMASLGTLAAGMAHEINNPLASIAANLDYVQAGLDDETPDARSREDLGSAVSDARDGTKRIAQLVRDLQLFSIGEGRRSEIEPVVVEHAIRSAQRLCRPHLERLDEVKVQVDPDVTIAGSDAELVRVLVNLLVNAAQAMQEADSPEKRIRVRARQQGPWVEIEVQDTGPGIDQALTEKIFDPFFTTKDVGKGTGLGLSITHQLVLKIGGTIQIRETGENGTTFFLRLPSHEAKQGAPELERPTPPSVLVDSIADIRVLVVEDDALIVRVLQRTLGPNAVFVERGQDALDRLASESFDVVLCDVMMPGMNGRELFERIQAEHPSMAPRVLFMTGGAFTDDARAFLERVPNRCLTKPLRFDELRAAVREVGRAA